MAAFSLTLVARGMTYQKLERVLIDAHSLLLQNFADDAKVGLSLISSRCERFSAIIKHSSVPRSEEILQLQFKVVYLDSRTSSWLLQELFYCKFLMN